MEFLGKLKNNCHDVHRFISVSCVPITVRAPTLGIFDNVRVFSALGLKMEANFESLDLILPTLNFSLLEFSNKFPVNNLTNANCILYIYHCFMETYVIQLCIYTVVHIQLYIYTHTQNMTSLR